MFETFKDKLDRVLGGLTEKPCLLEIVAKQRHLELPGPNYGPLRYQSHPQGGQGVVLRNVYMRMLSSNTASWRVWEIQVGIKSH